MALKKLCRCGKLLPYGSSLCPVCKIKVDKNKRESIRDNKGVNLQEIYNSKAWKITVKLIEQRDNNLCQLCLSRKRISFKNTVHHITPLREDTRLAFTHSNLLCLCESCHQLVHKVYKDGGRPKVELQKLLRSLVKGEGEVKKY